MDEFSQWLQIGTNLTIVITIVKAIRQATRMEVKVELLWDRYIARSNATRSRKDDTDY